MLVRSKIDQLETLRDLEVKPMGIPWSYCWGRFGRLLTVLSLSKSEKDLLDPESETYFCPHEDQEICGFLKINWGQAQTD